MTTAIYIMAAIINLIIAVQVAYFWWKQSPLDGYVTMIVIVSMINMAAKLLASI